MAWSAAPSASASKRNASSAVVPRAPAPRLGLCPVGRGAVSGGFRPRRASAFRSNHDPSRGRDPIETLKVATASRRAASPSNARVLLSKSASRPSSVRESMSLRRPNRGFRDGPDFGFCAAAVRCCPHAKRTMNLVWEVPDRYIGSSRQDVGLAEVVTLEQERFAGRFREGIGEAVPKVQPGLVSPLPEIEKGLAR
jgi:hypothetical protein